MPTSTAAPLIAIANHDAVLLGLLRTTFENEGYRTMLLPTGSPGYQVVKDHKPDLVLLDTWLDNESGAWLLVQIMRMDPDTKHIPVLLASSGLSNFDKVAEALPKESGVDVLPKPYDASEVLAKARMALERHQNS